MAGKKIKWTWQGCQVREDCRGAYEGRCEGCARQLVLKSEALRAIDRAVVERTAALEAHIRRLKRRVKRNESRSPEYYVYDSVEGIWRRRRRK